MTDAPVALDASTPTRQPWVTVLASFIGSSVSISPAFLIPFGLYIKPMSAELGWSRTQLSLGVSVVALVSVLLTPVAGALIDRRGARPLAWVGAIGMPIALVCLSRLPASYPIYVTLAACLGIVSVAGSPMTYLAVLPQWIHKRLGQAIAFSMIGLGVAAMAQTPATKIPVPADVAAPPADAAADWTVDQAWYSYTSGEHQVWLTLYERQAAIWPGRACDEFLRGLDALDLHGQGIPDFKRVNERLGRLTGWSIVAVHGLVPDEVFFDHLANRRFPAGRFIRKPEELD